MSRVSNFADGRDLKIEPLKIRGTPFLMGGNCVIANKKNNECLSSADASCRSVRVLMHVYALVSMVGPIGEEW